MKFTIKSGDLLDVMSLLRSFQSPIEAIASTYDILVEAADDQIVLAMFGAANAAVVSVDATVTEPGAILVTPSKILPALNRNKRSYVVISDTDKGQIQINWEGSEDIMVLEGGLPETFYQFEVPPQGEGITLTLDEALKADSTFSSLGNKLGFVQASYLDEEHIDLISTDEYTLALTTVEAKADIKGDWYLPPTVLPMLSGMAKSLNINGETKIKIQTGEQFTYLIYKRGFFRSTVPAMASPIPYQELFEVETHSIEVDRLKFVKDVQALAALATEHESVELHFGDEFEMKFSSQLSGSCSYKYPISSTPGSIKVSVHQLAKLAKATFGKGKLKIHWGETCLILTDENKELLIGADVG